MKICIKCQIEFKKNNYASRIRNICNQCHANHQKEYKEKNKDIIREYQKEYQKQYRLKNKLLKN